MAVINLRYMQDTTRRKVEIEPPLRRVNQEAPIPPEIVPVPNKDEPFPIIPEIVPLGNPEISPVKDCM